MRTLKDIESMSGDDYKCGIPAHYKPLSELVKSRGFKVGVELGTAYGNNAKYLTEHNKLDLLVCIDPYIFYPAMPGFICQEEYDILYLYALDKLLCHKVLLVRSSSRQFISYISSSRLPSVDFVFVDANHQYESVKFDIENYWTIINETGTLCGHDYNIFEGVNKAVDEFALSIGKTVEVLDGNIWVINK